MVKLIIRVVINMIALWVAAYFVGGVTLTDDLVQWIVIAVVFGLVNAFIKPIIKLLTLPFAFQSHGAAPGTAGLKPISRTNV